MDACICMDEWTEGPRDGGMDGQREGWMNGWIDVGREGEREGWMDGQMGA